MKFDLLVYTWNQDRKCAVKMCPTADWVITPIIRNKSIYYHTTLPLKWFVWWLSSIHSFLQCVKSNEFVIELSFWILIQKIISSRHTVDSIVSQSPLQINSQCSSFYFPTAFAPPSLWVLNISTSRAIISSLKSFADFTIATHIWIPSKCPKMCPWKEYNCHGGCQETCVFLEGFCEMMDESLIEYKINRVQV